MTLDSPEDEIGDSRPLESGYVEYKDEESFLGDLTDEEIDWLIAQYELLVYDLKSIKSCNRLFSMRSCLAKRMYDPIEKIFEWKSWRYNLPYLKFDPSWEVKIIPPFHGLIARFLVKSGQGEVSVFFDAYDSVGSERCPYWEVYCFLRKEWYTFLSGDEDEMMEKIRFLLSQEKNE